MTMSNALMPQIQSGPAFETSPKVKATKTEKPEGNEPAVAAAFQSSRRDKYLLLIMSRPGGDNDQRYYIWQ